MQPFVSRAAKHTADMDGQIGEASRTVHFQHSWPGAVSQRVCHSWLIGPFLKGSLLALGQWGEWCCSARMVLHSTDGATRVGVWGGASCTKKACARASEVVEGGLARRGHAAALGAERGGQQGGVAVDERVLLLGSCHERVQAALAERGDAQEGGAHAEHGGQREGGHLRARMAGKAGLTC